MAAEDEDQLKRRNVRGPGFLEHVETSSLKDSDPASAPEFRQAELLDAAGPPAEAVKAAAAPEVSDGPPVKNLPETPPAIEVSETPPSAKSELRSPPPPAASETPLAGGIVTRLAPPSMGTRNSRSGQARQPANRVDRRDRDEAEPLLATRWIVLMLIVGLVTGAIIGFMVGMSLFP